VAQLPCRWLEKLGFPVISMIQWGCVSCEVVMYVIAAASVDANMILADEERLILSPKMDFALEIATGS